jgi:hypothetical protein
MSRGDSVIQYDFGESCDGNHLWTRFHGTTDGESVRTAAIDAAGNLWVAGSTLGSFPGHTLSGFSDAFALKLDSAGGSINGQPHGGSDDIFVIYYGTD